MTFDLDDDSGPPPALIPLPDVWRVEAGATVRRIVGQILAAVPRLIHDPESIKDFAMRNVRSRLIEAAPDIDRAFIKVVRDAGYSVAAYHEALAVHYANMADVEIDRVLAERDSS